MTTIIRHLDRNDVPRVLLGDYTGRQLCAQITDAVTIPATAGLWDGGSRDTFKAVQLSNGATVTMADADAFDGRQRDRRVTIPAGIAVIRRSIFQGRDTGLTIYIRPEDAAPLLPAPSLALNADARAVLDAARSLKPAYRADECARQGIDAACYAELKNALIGGGYLNAAGAITTKGKNALND